jgi:transcriptional regulator with XRE-family HTH domain
MSTIAYRDISYVGEGIAKSDEADSVRRVPRTPKPFAGPITFGSVIGEFIRRERTARGWTQKDMAEHASINQSQLSAIETGARNVSATHIEAVLTAFAIPPRDAFSMLAGLVPELERELRNNIVHHRVQVPMAEAIDVIHKARERERQEEERPALLKPPPTHTLDKDGYKKKPKGKADEVSSEPPTTHREK